MDVSFKVHDHYVKGGPAIYPVPEVVLNALAKLLTEESKKVVRGQKYVCGKCCVVNENGRLVY